MFLGKLQKQYEYGMILKTCYLRFAFQIFSSLYIITIIICLLLNLPRNPSCLFLNWNSIYPCILLNAYSVWWQLYQIQESFNKMQPVSVKILAITRRNKLGQKTQKNDLPKEDWGVGRIHRHFGWTEAPGQEGVQIKLHYSHESQNAPKTQLATLTLDATAPALWPLDRCCLYSHCPWPE